MLQPFCGFFIPHATKIKMGERYVLITPARNEEAYIEETIEAVISQTVLPLAWVIVSDGSTDRTDEMVLDYSDRYDFLYLLRRNSDERNFESKVRSIDAGYQKLKEVRYDFIGNLDADVSFGHECFERLLEKFREDPDLGIGGGIINELIDGKFRPQIISLNSVAGAVQLFRRNCYEQIGGYLPIPGGGIDSAAEIMARMHGWRVRTFPDIKVLHYRRVTTGKRNILGTRFQNGVTNYLLGYHPIFQILSCLYRLVERPYLVGTLLILAGYCWSCVRRYPRPLPLDAIRFLRSEQKNRIRKMLHFIRQRATC